MIVHWSYIQQRLGSFCSRLSLTWSAHTVTCLHQTGACTQILRSAKQVWSVRKALRGQKWLLELSQLAFLCHAPFTRKGVTVAFPTSSVLLCFAVENVWQAPSHKQPAAAALDPGLQAVLLQRSKAWACHAGKLTTSVLGLARPHTQHCLLLYLAQRSLQFVLKLKKPISCVSLCLFTMEWLGQQGLGSSSRGGLQGHHNSPSCQC